MNTFKTDIQNTVTQIQDAMIELEVLMRSNENTIIEVDHDCYSIAFDGFSVMIDFSASLPDVSFHNDEDID